MRLNTSVGTQRHDQARVHADVAHLVDLQLRQWVSAELRALNTAGDKVLRAQVLNGWRKSFLADLKVSQASTRDADGAVAGDAAGTGSGADNYRLKRLLHLVACPTWSKSCHESIRGLVAALVALFQSEYVGCELSSTAKSPS